MAEIREIDQKLRKAGASDAEIQALHEQSANKAAEIMKKLLTGQTLAEQEKALFEKYNNGIKAEEFIAFNELGTKHLKEYPALGAPVEIFRKDGYPCAKWSNGVWFHYDLKNKSWF